MFSLVELLGGWTWFILGLALLAVEVLVPGFFFLWFGIAAVIIGLSALLFTWPWQLQILGFAILSVVAAVVGRKVFAYHDTPSEDPNLNLRAERLKGRTFVLNEPIEQGSGRVKIDDSVWRVNGPDLPAGARITVTGAEGATLQVSAVEG